MERKSPTQARAVIQRIVDGRITFTPDGNGCVFTPKTWFSKRFAGVAGPRAKWVADRDLRGAEDLTPEDTNDADYGRLLERAEEREVRVKSPSRSVQPVRVSGRLRRAA
jgi:hypothetical protein